MPCLTTRYGASWTRFCTPKGCARPALPLPSSSVDRNARSGEVRGARWDEIDLEAAKVWRIPAERMKSDRPHVVPLSIEAHLLLQDAKAAIKKREKSEKRRPDYDSSFESDPMPDAGLDLPSPIRQAPERRCPFTTHPQGQARMYAARFPIQLQGLGNG